MTFPPIEPGRVRHSPTRMLGRFCAGAGAIFEALQLRASDRCREYGQVNCIPRTRVSSPTLPRRGGWTTKWIKRLEPLVLQVTLAMDEAPTTVIIQRYLDALPGDAAAEPLIRELLEQAVGRLRLLC